MLTQEQAPKHAHAIASSGTVLATELANEGIKRRGIAAHDPRTPWGSYPGITTVDFRTDGTPQSSELATEVTMVKCTRAAIYSRVSTDGQTIDNEVIALKEAAERRGWKVVGIYLDQAINRAKVGRDKRPGVDRLFKDASRRKFDVVMAWAIDRMGRSLGDLIDTIEHIEAAGVDLYLDQQNLDTTTPAGKLLFHVIGAFAEFERSTLSQSIRAGIARARVEGRRPGRPRIDPITEAAIRAALESGRQGMVKIAATFRVGNGTVQRIKDDMRRAATEMGTMETIATA
jgi:DNA invertase Pin-like site-specific DNA recombinase